MGNSVATCGSEAVDVLNSTTKMISHATSKRGSSSKVVVVVTQTGEVLEFAPPIKAAEVMMDYPNYFVCHSSSFRLGQRVLPLPSHQDLHAAHLYFLLPMHRLHSRLSLHDMQAFLGNKATAHQKAARKLYITKHYYPFKPSTSSCSDHPPLASPRSPSSLLAQRHTANLRLVPKWTGGNCSAWRPGLQTIAETPSCRALFAGLQINLN